MPTEEDDNRDRLERQARALEAVVTGNDGTTSTVPIKGDPHVAPALYEALQGLVAVLAGFERYRVPPTHEIVVERLRHARAVMAEARGDGRQAAALRMTFDSEWFLQGLRHGPGEYVLTYVGPAKSDYPIF